mmetsp:Transcript_871/g.897  ORF Transcript_871/g.897 Transcript_871/m.897 type:complete len:372 (+) Transcript_871:77-1192(+)|eukprot:CAMPEP_0173145494 /NCGR_PEP_ID=MMETSP1105-20130129/7892_1 /TAXON_ID=2985 /ORGANISM="Ochromonas sp., Strain BG-1" /LENGTH=371 /DNA_ID=CAMNT_0014059437 /DNA_START=73 /DNA_END=1188 /DNA_ORIENTATION=-
MLSLPIGDSVQRLKSQLSHVADWIVKLVRGDEKVTSNYLVQHLWIVVSLGCYIKVALWKMSMAEMLGFVVKDILTTVLLHSVYYYFDFHKRWGPWQTSESPSHFLFTMETVWIVALFSIGNVARMAYYGMDQSAISKTGRLVLWDSPEQFHILKSDNPYVNWTLGILGFYMIDFLRYWAHRVGHNKPFYKTFPLTHAHHHNQTFLSPLIFKVSPLLHLASVATYTPPLLLAFLGNHRASIIAWSICFFPNVTQHLGFDPLPWLTRINHYYFYGALPWIPLYHSYHHNPFIKDGCYGNTTVLFDYVYGTTQPECIYHIENGRPMDKVLERFQDPVKLERIMKSMLYAGQGKARLDLNDEGYDWSLVPDKLEK